MKPWIERTTAEKVEAVRDALDKGYTHSQIGALYGCSRNASIGIAHRNKLSSLPPEQKRATTARKPKPPAPRKPKLTVVAPPPPPPPAPKPEPTVVESLRVLFIDRGRRCGWLDGERDAGGNITCCGHATEDGRWCAWHRRIVYRRAS